MLSDEKLIAQTQAWVSDVVVGDNFCPFARREVVNNRVRYVVVSATNLDELVMTLVQESQMLDANDKVETTLVIASGGLEDFDDFLFALSVAENQLHRSGYEGVYQLASFHPNYCFAGAEGDDPANYTNRSPYPTFHLIREESIARVLENVDDPDAIPERNISYAREQGLDAFRRRLQDILSNP